MSKQPVFIIGAARSGTRFLRDQLFASQDCTRIPYDVGYLWLRGNEHLRHDEVNPQSLSPQHVAWIQRNLPKLADRHARGRTARILLEKSVPNSLRPALLYRCFPDAKFIHVIRRGLAATESAYRMWQRGPTGSFVLDKLWYVPLSCYWHGLRYSAQRLNWAVGAPATWGPRYRGLIDDVLARPLHLVCAKQWSLCVLRSREQFAQIPTKQVLTVTYESLVQDPRSWLSLCEFIDINPVDVLSSWKHNVKPTSQNLPARTFTDTQRHEICSLIREILPDAPTD